jgi:hypothetical protein
VQHLEGKSSAHADAVLQKTGDDIRINRKFSISTAHKQSRLENYATKTDSKVKKLIEKE